MRVLAVSLLAFGAAYAQYSSSSSHPCPGYTTSNVLTIRNGFTADLTLSGSPCNVYGNDINDLVLTVTVEENNKVNVLIEDAAMKQYQIPQSVVSLNRNSSLHSFADLSFKYTDHPTAGFGFQVIRNDTILFDTIGHPIVFEDQYLELTSNLPKDANIYGIGEGPDTFRRDVNDTIKTLWNRDAANPYKQNTYGSHTVYMENRAGKFHGAYLHNSHGMDIVLANETIQYRVLGGVLDMHFFGGPSAYDVINSYTDLVGRPLPIPAATLGFQNCRYGYKSIDEVDQVIANYSAANIPLEYMWIDIDYMDRTRDFTFDPVNFPLPRIQQTLANLHSKKQKMVMMVDPAIQRNSTYGPYVRGVESNAFVKNADGSVYVGQVWPGYTAFPDWFATNATSYWHNELSMFYEQVPLDGLWIDMNEAASFCTGSCGSGVAEDVVPKFPWTVTPAVPPRIPNVNNTYLVPKYSIHNPQTEISEKSIETIAVHANGVIEYHVHNLYGHMMAKNTRAFLNDLRPNVRPFLLGRSTFAGSGSYVSHWNGDNNSDWDELYFSISSMLDFGIFGIPLVGSDICGFFSNTTEQLCNRWIEVGAFYPFSRVHNGIDSIPQELYRWDSVAESARRALGVRYALLPYYYTKASYSTINGSPIARPLIFEFPADTNVLDNDSQFMIGEAIMISPVLFENDTSVEAYIPNSLWYDWYDHSVVVGAGKNATLDAPLNHVNVHIRGGNVVPTQTPQMSVEDTLAGDYTLIVALDSNFAATGTLYLDDGVTYNSTHSIIKFYSDGKTLVANGTYSHPVTNVVEKIIVLANGDYTGNKYVNPNNTNELILDNLSLCLTESWNINLF
ncbi:Alpha-glucosidase [Smittium mucronatum]|uniref:Probable alpha/beta-glucosidase agdC n=1 Tax=Smittium mucronatum TaxID=133383 RepID=A0A1R0GLR7_9FUNG|nr:Alpha-glucosidase [Smittium mucronatum]